MRRYTLRSATAMDARALRDHMRAVLDDAEYSTPTTRDVAQARRRQEWTDKRVRIIRATPEVDRLIRSALDA